MSLNQIKVTVEDINGKRCIVVESGITADRAEFLSRLLKHNGYEVVLSNDDAGNYKIGVTDLLFNPVIDVYERRLLSFTNHKVTPAFWLQQSSDESIQQVSYWR